MFHLVDNGIDASAKRSRERDRGVTRPERATVIIGHVHGAHCLLEATMSDGTLLEIRVRLTRLASELAVARSERDLDQIAGEVARVRASLDALLTDLGAAAA